MRTVLSTLVVALLAVTPAYATTSRTHGRDYRRHYHGPCHAVYAKGSGGAGVVCTRSKP